jgi:hypothetical protein
VCLRLWLPRDGTLVPEARNGVAFLPSEAIDFLTCLAPTNDPAAGDSLCYWVRLARFITDRIARQQFYPSIACTKDVWQAHWKLLPGGSERIARLQRYAASMPPVCRAIVNGPPPDALTLVESFLNTTTDALVRRAVANDPFFTRVHALAAAPDSQADMRWLSALLGDNPTLRGNGDIPMLAEAVRAWTSRLDESGADSAWVLGFELIEPDLDDNHEQTPSVVDAPWRLVLRLHPEHSDQPRLDAADVWAEGGPALGALGRSLAERREHLRAEIERASAACPPLSRLLDDPSPAAISLTTAEAYQFLRRWSAALKEQSFVVVLPDWSIQSEDRLGLLMDLSPLEEDADLLETRANAAMSSQSIAPATGRMGLDSLLRFNWRVSLGGVDLPPD